MKLKAIADGFYIRQAETVEDAYQLGAEGLLKQHYLFEGKFMQYDPITHRTRYIARLDI